MKRLIGSVSLVLVAVLIHSLVSPVPWIEEPEVALGQVATSKISSLLDMQLKEKMRYLQKGGQIQSDEVVLPRLTKMPLEEVARQKIFIRMGDPPTSAQIKEFEAMGVTVYPDSWMPPLDRHLTGFVYAEAPITQIQELSAKTYVTSLQSAEVTSKPQNDLGAQATGIGGVWNLGYNGSGVKVAILDSGLDLTHGDIPAPIAKKDYSNYPVLDDDITNKVTGHGTHVTGTAMGRGTLSSGTYRGVAPGANLVFLKIGNDTNGDETSAATVAAIKAAVDTYGAKVISISYGGWSTYHDGSGETSQAADYVVSRGAVLFAAAGNAANDGQHYSGTVYAGNTAIIEVNVTGAGNSNTVLAFNMVWFDGLGVHNDLSIEYLENGIPVPSTFSSQSESPRGTESKFSRQIGYLPAGNSAKYLRLRNNSQSSQFFHLYYDPQYNLSDAGTVTFAAADPNYTIVAPAEADSAIAVGAYVTRTEWTNYQGQRYKFGETQVLGSIATFSSRGPRVDPGAPGKPNVVAPGSAIISAKDSIYTPGVAAFDPGIVAYGGTRAYFVMQGTSMAAPHAAGIAALLLSKHPGLSPAQIRTYLETTATDKGPPGWDDIFGWGLVNALAAINAFLPPGVTPTPTPSPTPPPPLSMAWARQFGTRESEGFGDVAASPSGDAYVVGATTGIFPGQSASGYYDAYIVKYDYSGNKVWSRQFGTGADDSASSVAVDGPGNIYVAGATSGSLPGQSSAGGSDAYIRKYDSGGNEIWTRQFGTSGNDGARRVAVDGSGNIFVVGTTLGVVPGQSSSGSIDGFIYKYGSSGNLVWARQFGTNSDDIVTDIKTDVAGNAWIVGYTWGTFAGQHNSGSRDGFMLKYDSDGNTIWVKQFGTAAEDYVYGVAWGGEGGAYVVGTTQGAFPGYNLIGGGGSDAFIRKYDANGSPVWTRQFGTTGGDSALGVAGDGFGNVYVAGEISYGALPGESYFGAGDAFLRKYNSNGDIVWTKQFGTAGWENSVRVSTDGKGHVYVAGQTNGNSWPDPQGQSDAFLTKFTETVFPPLPGPVPAPSPTPSPTPPPLSSNEVRKIDLATNDLVYDPSNRKIYASVPGMSDGLGHEIAIINPYTGALEKSVYIGLEPGKLAISDNGQYVYAAVEDGAVVRRFDTASQTAGPAFSLGMDEDRGTYRLQDMEVLPGNAQAIAIARRATQVAVNSSGGTAIYDNGEKRWKETPASDSSYVMEFGSSSSILYGYNESTQSFRKIEVDESGATIIDVLASPVAFGSDFRYDGGLIYTTSGKVFNPDTLTMVGSFAASGLVRPDSRTGRTFMLSTEANSYTVRAFDQKTFQQVGSVTIPYAPGKATSLLRWGDDGLAFRTSQNELFLIRSANLVPSPVPLPSPTPSPSPTPTPSPTPSPTAGGVATSWIRQFGTINRDGASSVAMDSSGNIYVVGRTHGSLPGQALLGNSDAYIRKYNPAGNELWTRQFGTSGDDGANGVAIDSAQNIYVVGFTAGVFPGQTASGGEDVFVRKYDASGNSLWTRQFGSADKDSANGVAVDRFGNLYMVGYATGELSGGTTAGSGSVFVARYDSQGNRIWTRQFGYGQGTGVTVDDSGNPYVVGWVAGALPGQTSRGDADVFVRKYDATGNEVWTRQFGTDWRDDARSVATDARGDVYVAGSISRAGSSSSVYSQAFLRKYNSLGGEVWMRQFGYYSVANGVAVDGKGSVYVVGDGGTVSDQWPGDYEGCFIRRYDSEGKAVWSSHFGTASTESSAGVVADGLSNVYVAGYTNGTFPWQIPSGLRDAFIIRFTDMVPPPTPTSFPAPFSWIRQFGDSGWDGARGIARDSGGNIYMAGRATVGSTSFPYSEMPDALLQKIDSQGKLLWSKYIGTSFADAAYAIALDRAENVYIAGYTDGILPGQTPGGTGGAFISKYDGSGNYLWARQFRARGADVANGVAVDGAGNAYVVGGVNGALPGQTAAGGSDAFIRKYGPGGDELWTRQFGSSDNDSAPGVAVDASGNVYVVGYVIGALPGQPAIGFADAFIRKYDNAGNELWTRQFGSSDWDGAESVALDRSGNVYVMGRTSGAMPGYVSSGSGDVFVRKYDGSGNELWTRQFGTSGFDIAYGSFIDSSDNLFVVGQVGGTLPGQTSAGGEDAFVREFDAQGNTLWTFQFGTRSSDSASSVTVDSSGAVYVAGTVSGSLLGEPYLGGGDAFVVRLLPGLMPVPTPTPSPTPMPSPTPTVTPTVPRMVSIWKFEESAGGVATDSVGGNHGTILGATSVPGIVGNALSFDGVDDYVLVPDSPGLQFSGEGSVELWVKQSGATGTLVMKRVYPGNDGWTLYFADPNYLVGYVNSNATWVSTNVIPGQWHHVAFVYESGWLKMYLDGLVVNMLQVPRGFQSATAPLKIGGNEQYRTFFTGLVDELAIYNRALTAGEISQHYQRGLAGLGYPMPTPSPTPTPTPTPAPPGAGFNKSLNPASGVIPCVVTFSDTSTNSPTGWSWSFGDGTGSSLQNPVKTYGTAGTYTVTLTATNAGGSSSTSQMVSIYSVPVASFTDTAASGVAPLTINFTDTSAGNIVTWLWQFGDGTTSSSRNPSKTYSSYGAYAVTLTVTNPAGSHSASAIKQVYTVPVAAFTSSATSAGPGAVINFADQSTGNVTGWSWNFGDGSGSSSQNPAKSYTSTGNYAVALTASNAAGSHTLTKTGYITVTSAALSLQAETGLLADLNAGGYAVVRARINRIKNTATGESHAIADGLGAYDAYVTYEAGGMNIVGVDGAPPFGSPVATLNTLGGTRTNFNAAPTGAAPAPPLALADLRLRLAGSKDNAYTLTLNFNSITRVSGSDLPQSGAASLTFRRGDAKADGTVAITDALFIAQYLAGLRSLGNDSSSVNPVNAAGVRQDDDGGDKITIADALYVAQMLAGLRNGSYNQ